MREGIYSRVSATEREKLEIIWVRGQNIEIFIKNGKFQDITPLFCIDRFNITILAMTLSKVIEVYKKYKAYIPAELRINMRGIYSDLKNREIDKFRNKYCGHILDKQTQSPIPDSKVAEMFQKIRGNSQYEDFEDWFWDTGRVNSERSIASVIMRIRDILIKQENISDQEMTLVF